MGSINSSATGSAGDVPASASDHIAHVSAGNVNGSTDGKPFAVELDWVPDYVANKFAHNAEKCRMVSMIFSQMSDEAADKIEEEIPPKITEEMKEKLSKMIDGDEMEKFIFTKMVDGMADKVVNISVHDMTDELAARVLKEVTFDVLEEMLAQITEAESTKENAADKGA